VAYADLRAFLDGLGDDLIRVDAPLDAALRGGARSLKAGAAAGPCCASRCRASPACASPATCSPAAGWRRARWARPRRASSTPTSTRSGQGVPPVRAAEVPVQEVVHRQPADVGALLPLMTHHEKDAAPFLTCGMVLARDPATGHARHGHPPHDVQGRQPLRHPARQSAAVAYLANAEPRGQAARRGGGARRRSGHAHRRGGQDRPARARQDGDRRRPARRAGRAGARPDGGSRRAGTRRGRHRGPCAARRARAGRALRREHRRLLHQPQPGHRGERRHPPQGFHLPGAGAVDGDVDTLLSLAGGAELLGQLKGLVRGVVDLELVPGTCSFAAVIAVKNCPSHEVRRLIHLALNLDRRLKSADGGRRRRRHPRSARSGLGDVHPLPAGARHVIVGGWKAISSILPPPGAAARRSASMPRAAPGRSSTRSPCRPPRWPGHGRCSQRLTQEAGMKLVVGISGASGAIYGIRILEVLQKAGVETHLVMSDSAKRTIVYETDYTIDDLKKLASQVHDINDVGACISSGSSACRHGHRALLDQDAVRHRQLLQHQPADPRRRRLPEGAAQTGADAARDAAAPRPPAPDDAGDGSRRRAGAAAAGLLPPAEDARGRDHAVGEQGARPVRPRPRPVQALDGQRGAGG
jgi:2,5-furandicarboxylate decarboxylase 1